MVSTPGCHCGPDPQSMSRRPRPRVSRHGSRVEPGMTGSKYFEHARLAHAAADAHRHEHTLGAAPFAFDERMAGQALARNAIGMTHGDGAAIDVQAIGGNAEPV